MPSDGMNVAGDRDAPAPQQSDVASEARELMGFSAFEQQAQEQPPSEPAPAGEGQREAAAVPPGRREGRRAEEQIPAEQSGQQPTPTPQPGFFDAPASQQPADSNAAIMQALQQITHMITSAQTRQQPPQAATAAREQAPRPPAFNLQVPEELNQQIFSEDPAQRAQGMNTLMTGLANAIWERTENLVRETEQRVIRAVPQTAHHVASAERERQNMRQTFFGEYPGLARSDALQNLVADTARGLAVEIQQRGMTYQWDERFRDEVARRVYTSLGMPPMAPVRSGYGQPAPQPAPAPQGNGTHYATGRGTRGGGREQVSEDVRDIWDTLGIQY